MKNAATRKTQYKIAILLYVSAFLLLGTKSHAQVFKIEGGVTTKDKNLKIKLSGVPAFNFVKKIKTIPALNIGSERNLSAASIPTIKNFTPLSLNLKPLRILPMVENKQVKAGDKFIQATKAQVLVSPDSFKKIPTVSELSPMPVSRINPTNLKTKELKDLQENDYKLLQALIFLEIHKKYELSMSLLFDLLKDKKLRIEALYNYALSAKGLKLNTEFRQFMFSVTNEASSKEWKEKSLDQLTSNTELLEYSDVGNIDSQVEKSDLDVTAKEQWQIYRAQYYSDKGDLGRADDALGLIKESSQFYPKAMIMGALLKYRLGQLEVSKAELKKALNSNLLQKADPLRNLAALTLARMHFQRSEFSEAYQTYLEIDRNSTHWLQAMTEQAWTQILSGDYEGASGNMFSLHTDYFKNAFAPETYVIRTVGYLNLCQYGDSIHVLQDMKKRYGKWKSDIDAYQKTHTASTDYYETFRNWAKSPDLNSIDGLPRSFIVELARHPSFLAVQKQINNYDDEISRFNELAISVLRIEKSILEQQNDLAKRKFKDEDERQAALEPLKMELAVAKKARLAIKEARQNAVTRLDKEKTELKLLAGKVLTQRFKILQSSINEILDQNEVLAYEIYSGAGEHIRHQMAGGEINDKAQTELKVAQEKSVNWKFKGEIWEDEIGHYRSSLKNVCPKDVSSN